MRTTEPSWGLIRDGLLADLGLPTPEALAHEIGYTDVAHLTRALQRTIPPNDDLMAALLRHYLTVPSLYFVERPTDRTPAHSAA